MLEKCLNNLGKDSRVSFKIILRSVPGLIIEGILNKIFGGILMEVQNKLT